MTLDELDRRIDAMVKAHEQTSPVISFSALAPIVCIPNGSWHNLTYNLGQGELPPLFIAGGSRHLMITDAAEWCKEFVRRNPRRHGVTEEVA